MNPAGALEFILTTIVKIYIFIVLARFILQLVRADFYNPLSQFVVKATSPVLNPLRRMIPGFGGIDVASVVLFMLLVIFLIILTQLLRGVPINVMPSLIFSLQFLVALIATTAGIVLDFFIYSIFLMVIMSWVSQGSYNPAADVLRQITDPIMAPARRLIPPMGGLDLSPMVVLLLLSTLRIFFGV